MKTRGWIAFFLAFVLFGIAKPVRSFGATFPGNARVEAQDSTGDLSWKTATNALTVSCWFKISVPTNVSISDNMVIVVNNRTGNSSSPFSYLIQFNATNGNVEFSARGTSTYTRTLIQRPYLERWYHLAVVRSGTGFTGYVDGLQVFSDTQDIGSSTTTDGLSIGGWGNGKYLYGEVQEVAIYQAALSQELIVELMYADQQSLIGSLPELRGYYKLAYPSITGYDLNNLADNPAAGPLSNQGAGTVTFEQADAGGEQSIFDSRKNAGRDALAPLSGAFTWQQTALSRRTAGVPFEFQIGYSSGNVFNNQTLGSFNPFATSILGGGWRNSFDVRVVPSQYFSPISGLDSMGLMMWDGSMEVWDYDYSSNQYLPRHKEYRGEFQIINTSTCEWVTPDRLTYHFYHPFSGSSIMRGRLKDIQDTNGNKLTVTWDTVIGRVTKVTDTAGADWTFNYNAQGLLISVTGLGWSVNFTYDANNRLATKSITGPAAYSATPALNTQWQFFYNATSGLLERITDPRGNDDARIVFDKYGRKTSVTDASNRVVATDYNVPATRQITTTDPAGKQWIETLDRKGHTTQKKDPLGNTNAFEYDGFGNVSKNTDARGNITQFTYDTRANMLTKTDALGKVWTWEYNQVLTSGVACNKPTKEIRPATVEAPSGWETRYTYDPATGNLLKQDDDIGTLVTYTYTSRGLVDSSKDANNHTSSFAYTLEGFLQSKTDAAGKTTTYTRSELGWTLSETNALSQTTTISYNINGQVIQILDPLSRTIKKDYDAAGSLISERDAKNQQTTYQYDNTDRLISKTDRAGSLWQQSWTPLGKIASTTDPDGKQTIFSYDDAGRLQKETDPLNYFTTHEYDANGNETALVDKLAQRWQKTYDALNRVITEKDPLGNVRQTAYDDAGRIQTIVTPRGYTQTHAYDGRGRLATWTDAQGFSWKYTYDGVGNILDIEDALHGHYVMSYGQRNERLTEKNQDNKTWIYTYDELLRLSTQADPNGVTRTLNYDNGGRVTGVIFSTGRTHSLNYDVNNNPLLITRTVSGVPTTTTLSYDTMDRVLSSTDTFNQSVGYSYDNPGRIKTITYPGNKVLTRDYDAMGRLVKITDWTSRITTFAYDAAGRLTTRGYPNGLTQTLAYDTAGHVTDLQHKSGSTALIALNYAYDANGNTTYIREKGTLGVSNPQAFDETASFTAAGRLVSRTDADDPTHSKDFSYSYDENGNMIQATSSGLSYAFTYDEDNRVLTVGNSQGSQTNSIQNRYDAMGRRIARTLNGAETRYVLDLVGGMERILCDTGTNGNVLGRYVHGGDLVYCEDAQTGTITCYHSDNQQNIVRTTDASGSAVNEYAFSPYGRTLASSGTANNTYKYVGSLGVMEELPGLYFMRARYYSAEAGVFLSTDPVKNIGPGWKPELYLYAGNPIRWQDPSGRTFKETVGDSNKAYGLFSQALVVIHIIGDISDVIAVNTSVDEFLSKDIPNDGASLLGYGVFLDVISEFANTGSIDEFTGNVLTDINPVKDINKAANDIQRIAGNYRKIFPESNASDPNWSQPRYQQSRTQLDMQASIVLANNQTRQNVGNSISSIQSSQSGGHSSAQAAVQANLYAQITNKQSQTQVCQASGGGSSSKSAASSSNSQSLVSKATSTVKSVLSAIKSFFGKK